MRLRLLASAPSALLAVAAGAGLRRHQARHHAESRQGRGDEVPRSARRRRSSLRVKGEGQVWVHVCKSTAARTSDGVICDRREHRPREAPARAASTPTSRASSTSPGFWLNTPGTYYWQAHRTAATAIRTAPQRRVRDSPAVEGRSSSSGVGMPVRIGCSGWNYADWRERFYPPRPAGAALARALRHAVRHRRGQRDLLPAREARGGRRLGGRRRRRTSSSRSRRAAT